MAKRPGKKTRQINVAVTPELAGRAARLEAETGIKSTEMGRVGLVEVINRLEGGLPMMMTVSPDILRAVAECHALEIDPVQALRERIASLTPSAS